jgi:hypothetical protein
VEEVDWIPGRGERTFSFVYLVIVVILRKSLVVVKSVGNSQLEKSIHLGTVNLLIVIVFVIVIVIVTVIVTTRLLPESSRDDRATLRSVKRHVDHDWLVCRFLDKEG